MNKLILGLGLGLLLVASPLLANKSCDELKAEITEKMEAHKVMGTQLSIVAKDEVKDQKVVGSCEGGSKRIIYKRAAAKPPVSTPVPTVVAPG